MVGDRDLGLADIRLDPAINGRRLVLSDGRRRAEIARLLALRGVPFCRLVDRSLSSSFSPNSSLL